MITLAQQPSTQTHTDAQTHSHAHETKSQSQSIYGPVAKAPRASHSRSLSHHTQSQPSTSCAPNLRTYNTVLRGCLRWGAVETALRVFHAMSTPSSLLSDHDERGDGQRQEHESDETMDGTFIS